MLVKQKLFNNNDIFDCVFNNTFPKVVVYPFRQSKRDDINLMPFTIQLNSLLLESKEPAYSILSKLLISIKNQKIDATKTELLFANMSPIVNNLMFTEVLKSHGKWKQYFDDNILEFSKQTKSKFQWEMAKSIGIDVIFNKPYSYEQKMWIVCANFAVKRSDQQFIIDIVESLKPWFNNELYHAIKKNDDNKKQNVLFEKQRAEMLEGSFGLSENDQRIFDNIEQQKNKDIQSFSNEEDLDIIN